MFDNLSQRRADSTRSLSALSSILQFFNLEGSVAHAARRGDGRQEGCESGYYDLHRNLNKTLFLHSLRFQVSGLKK
jgi:hypothetical protein